MQFLDKQKEDLNKLHKEYQEIQLTDAISGLLQKETVLACPYEGKRYDCGSVLGFLKANVNLGKIHPIEGKNFSQWLQQ